VDVTDKYLVTMAADWCSLDSDSRNSPVTR